MPDWFIVNVADAPALSDEHGVKWTRFESPDEPFPDFGINVHVLSPGAPNCLYHSESVQEDFLVLSGECIAIIDGREHPLRAWDFLHCPAGTAHVFVGAGDRPCAILMVGARPPDIELKYPFNEVAAKHGASAKKTSSDPNEAYADWDEDFKPATLDWPQPGSHRAPARASRPSP